MLNAGTACFEKICKIFGESLANSRVAVFCGNGKNAGDGFVIADLLNGINVNADIIICDKEPSVDEPKMYFDKAIANGVKAINFTDIGENSYDIIVDCIFGIGFHGQPRAPFSEIFDYINDNYKYAEILPEFNRNNIKKYANLFSNTYDTLNYAWFTINKQGIEDRITFIKLMIDLVNKKIEQENN